jgi:hypothetical protein
MGSLLMGSLLMGSLTGRLVPGNRDDDNLEFHVHDCDSCPVAASVRLAPGSTILSPDLTIALAGTRSHP